MIIYSNEHYDVSFICRRQRNIHSIIVIVMLIVIPVFKKRSDGGNGDLIPCECFASLYRIESRKIKEDEINVLN